MNEEKREQKPAHIQVLLARNLKEARARLKLTQELLAEKANLTTAFIGEVEICRKFPRPHTLQKIADVLGLKPYQLFLEDSDANELDKQKLFSQLLVELRGKIDAELEQTLMKYSRE